jgi:alkaline phosphatase D
MAVRPRLDRREFLVRVGAAGAVLWLPGCGGSGGGDPGPTPPPPTGTFRHGVASGDPLEDRVILWTRVSVDTAGPVQVEWVIARDAGLTDVAAQGTASAEAARDYIVKVDPTGLAPGVTYYYRFTAAGEQSPIGRTRTTPVGSVPRLRLGVVSCASYPHGFFNAYARLAERADLDAVVHLGDYVYEYGNGPGEYGADVQAGGRIYDPPWETVTLADFRRRFAHYRLDADVRAMHRQHPVIAVWDDHESACDAWVGGAANHNAGEGDWTTRKAAAVQAYREWMPIRDVAASDPQLAYRRFRFGDLVDLILLESRLLARSQQGTPPLAPVTLFEDAGDFADPARQLLGATQESWLSAELAASTARWRLLGQQVMVGQLKANGQPNSDNTATPGGQGGVFLNPDQWDGYPRARERLWAMIRGAAGHPNVAVPNVVVLTGDIHSSWAMDITEDPNNPDTLAGGYDPATGAGSMAVEFVGTSVTSPGAEELAGFAEAALMGENPHLKFVDLARHGYLIVDIDATRCQGEWWYVDSILAPTSAEHFGAAWFTNDGTNHLQPSLLPSAPPGVSPPLAP